jgi:hypothetical protein
MDTEDIMELSEKMSAISAGYKNGVVLQAALNVCAMVIVNTYDNREEVDRAAGQLAVRLCSTVTDRPMLCAWRLAEVAVAAKRRSDGQAKASTPQLPASGSADQYPQL